MFPLKMFLLGTKINHRVSTGCKAIRCNSPVSHQLHLCACTSGNLHHGASQCGRNWMLPRQPTLCVDSLCKFTFFSFYFLSFLRGKLDKECFSRPISKCWNCFRGSLMDKYQHNSEFLTENLNPLREDSILSNLILPSPYRNSTDFLFSQSTSNTHTLQPQQAWGLKVTHMPRGSGERQPKLPAKTFGPAVKWPACHKYFHGPRWAKSSTVCLL